MQVTSKRARARASSIWHWVQQSGAHRAAAGDTGIGQRDPTCMYINQPTNQPTNQSISQTSSTCDIKRWRQPSRLVVKVQQQQQQQVHRTTCPELRALCYCTQRHRRTGNSGQHSSSDSTSTETSCAYSCVRTFDCSPATSAKTANCKGWTVAGTDIIPALSATLCVRLSGGGCAYIRCVVEVIEVQVEEEEEVIEVQVEEEEEVIEVQVEEEEEVIEVQVEEEEEVIEVQVEEEEEVIEVQVEEEEEVIEVQVEVIEVQVEVEVEEDCVYVILFRYFLPNLGMAALIGGLGALLGGAFAMRKAEQEVDELLSNKNDDKAIKKAEAVGRQIECENEKVKDIHRQRREGRDDRRLDIRLKHGLSKPSQSAEPKRTQSAAIPNEIEMEKAGLFGKAWKKRHATTFCGYLVLYELSNTVTAAERIPLADCKPHFDREDEHRRTICVTTAQVPPVTYRFRAKNNTQAAALRSGIERESRSK
eukprot:gene3542-6154_t